MAATAVSCDSFAVCACASVARTEHVSSKQGRIRMVLSTCKREWTCLGTIPLSVPEHGVQDHQFHPGMLRVGGMPVPTTPSRLPRGPDRNRFRRWERHRQQRRHGTNLCDHRRTSELLANQRGFPGHGNGLVLGRIPADGNHRARPEAQTQGWSW